MVMVLGQKKPLAAIEEWDHSSFLIKRPGVISLLCFLLIDALLLSELLDSIVSAILFWRGISAERGKKRKNTL